MSDSWLKRLRSGLARSSDKLTGGIAGIFTGRRLDDEALEELEEVLISADLGVSTAGKLSASLAKTSFDRDVSAEDVRRALSGEISKILEPVAEPLDVDDSHTPHVILVVGVNGSGKTTTIGKLAKAYTDAGGSVMLAAGDTFRAAAIEQLQIWGERVSAPVIARDSGADAAGLAFDALKQAQEEKRELLLIDTAGRLHNKEGLMAELQKISRVIKKIDPSAPHEVLLVLDATTGQNAIQQVATFKEMVDVTGLVLTKLDGSARGGVLVALAEKFSLPVYAIGIGEGVEDLRPFDAQDFADSLLDV